MIRQTNIQVVLEPNFQKNLSRGELSFLGKVVLLSLNNCDLVSESYNVH